MTEKNEYRIYMDILTEAKFSSIKLTNMDLIYWSVRSSSRRGRDGKIRVSLF